MKSTTIISLLLSAYCFLSVLMQQREIAGLEKRLTEAEYLNILVNHQAKLIKELSDSSTDNTVKITGLERRIDQRPAPIGITPGQGTVKPPCIVPAPGTVGDPFNPIKDCAK